tara:strand:+ start:1810 stop:2199 length:390 start_codon:yes stop_codon:yes gene_type:complete
MENSETPNHDALDEICTDSQISSCLVMREYDSALLGYYYDITNDGEEYIRSVYSKQGIVNCLVQSSDFMDEDDASEYFSFNIERSLPHFPKTPLVIEDVNEHFVGIIKNKCLNSSHCCDVTKGDHPCDP